MSGTAIRFREFAEACGEASRRTRNIMVVLVVGCVLSLAGFMNSLSTGWMLQRLRVAGDPSSAYVASKLGLEPVLEDGRYRALYSAIVRSYVENALAVEVPFFGIAFDVNDLGLLGGTGLLTVLMLLRFSIRAEIISLRLAFKAAARETGNDARLFEEFYDLLAMRQVLTLPPARDASLGWSAHQSRMLRIAPKFVCLLPIAVYSLVAIHDFATQGIAGAINATHTWVLLAYTGVFWIAIAWMSALCFRKLASIDGIWREYWDRMTR